MTDGKSVLTRRDFIRAGACLTAGGLMGMPFFGPHPAKGETKSRVVLVRDMGVLSSTGAIRARILENMLDRSLTTLMETTDPLPAWERLVKPADVVGVKSNAWYHLPTPPALETAIRKRLEQVGVREENIAVDDRGVLSHPVFQHATTLINARPMRTHHWSGLGTLIKNYIMFTPRPSDYHGNACENLGAVWHLPHVKGKTRLNILVMLTPQFHGVGPHNFSRDYIWNYCGLVVSTDPVAADATGARIIQAKRNAFFGKEKPISPSILHIAAADTKFGLGNSSPDRIDLIRIGAEKDILL